MHLVRDLPFLGVNLWIKLIPSLMSSPASKSFDLNLYECEFQINYIFCRCPIHLCTELCCELTGVLPVPCSPLTKYHYKCKCPPEKTLPGGLLLFIRLVLLVQIISTFI